MNKLKFVAGAFVLALTIVGGVGAYVSSPTDSSLISLNVEALSQQESGTQNTGPGKTYDCPGWGTGDGKMCMCTNGQPCTEIPC